MVKAAISMERCSHRLTEVFVCCRPSIRLLEVGVPIQYWQHGRNHSNYSTRTMAELRGYAVATAMDNRTGRVIEDQTEVISIL